MPAKNAAERRAIASIAALSRSAKESSGDRLAAANRAYRASFNLGHACNACTPVEIDQELPAEEIERRGTALYKRHMRALAHRRDRNRRLAEEHQAEADAADAELARVATAE